MEQEDELKVVALCISGLIGLLSLCLMLETLLWRIPKTLQYTMPLADKSLLLLVCFGCLVVAAHPIPSTLYGDGQLTDSELRTVCFSELALLHGGISILYSVLLLEIYRLSVRVRRVKDDMRLCPQMLGGVLPCNLASATYLFLWLYLVPHDTKHCMVSVYQNYLFIVENVILVFSFYMLTTSTTIQERSYSCVVYVALCVSFVGGITVYVLRVIFEGDLSKGYRSILAAAHSFVYTFVLLFGNVFLICKSIKSGAKVHVLGRLTRSMTSLFWAWNREGSIRSERNFVSKHLSIPRRLGKRTDVPTLPDDPDELTEVWY